MELPKITIQFEDAQFYAVATVSCIFLMCCIIGTFIVTECGRSKIWFVHRGIIHSFIWKSMSNTIKERQELRRQKQQQDLLDFT